MELCRLYFLVVLTSNKNNAALFHETTSNALTTLIVCHCGTFTAEVYGNLSASVDLLGAACLTVKNKP